MNSVGKNGNLLKRKLPGTLKTAAKDTEEHTKKIEENNKNTNNER